MAFGLPAMIVLGQLNPRTADLESLRVRTGETALLVGSATGGENCHPSAPCEFIPPQRSYIVLPRALLDVSVMVVEDYPERQIVTKARGAALFILLVWLACGYATWLYLIAPIWRFLTMRWSGS